MPDVVSEVVTWFHPQPLPEELPGWFPNPFVAGPPHPLARRAAEELQAGLRSGQVAGLDRAALDACARGRMFGVLVVATREGRVGYLRGFSGMLAGRWEVEGFVPPLFDCRARDAVWPAGEAELRAFEQRHRELTGGPETVALRATLEELRALQTRTAEELRAHQGRSRARRRELRERLAGGAGDAGLQAELRVLEEEGRQERDARRRLDVAQQHEREALTLRLREIDAQREALEQARAERSRELLQQLWDGYVFENARGEQRALQAVYAPDVPHGGAGDCAAPKLLGAAYRHGLRPLALAEFWWGAAPIEGAHRDGEYSPSCRTKCSVVLPFMLDGVSVEPPLPRGQVGAPGGALHIVFEDAWLVVVDKPSGLLTVPGRHEPARDSVLARLHGRNPVSSGLRAMYALDAETSGLVLVTKDLATHAALQRQNALREAHVRYVALLEGALPSEAGESGVIELPLRSDPADKRRQRVDTVHGKAACTEWQRIANDGGRSRLALVPRSGRTHQLRVHAAQGLELPVVGDRLYGRADSRLMLHAEVLSFRHPDTGQRVELVSPAPF